MLGYSKFMKDLVTKKRSMDCEAIKMTHQVSAIVQSMVPKLEDPGSFTIHCTIGNANFAKALCDLEESIILMPYSVFKTLGIRQPRATLMRLQMADRTMKRPLSIIDDVLVRVDKFILLVDFVILDCEDEGQVECVNVLHGMGSYSYELRKLSLDLENRKTPPTKPSIEEPLVLELKSLHPHLRYEFLGPSSTLPVILSSWLTNMQCDPEVYPGGGAIEYLRVLSFLPLWWSSWWGKDIFEAFHLPVELEHKAMWALRKLNLKWDVAINLCVEQLNEHDEFRFHAYSSLSLYKDKMKYIHDKYARGKEFKVVDLVLLFNSRLRLFLEKLKSK
ncbi:uncharacterized protein [Nicotiana sylvestris]|uniref:uncharacterized protein n=1 Tax=Nicotiana sylvestris TaxID=4096 RepID=UPI00388CE5D4